VWRRKNEHRRPAELANSDSETLKVVVRATSARNVKLVRRGQATNASKNEEARVCAVDRASGELRERQSNPRRAPDYESPRRIPAHDPGPAPAGPGRSAQAVLGAPQWLGPPSTCVPPSMQNGQAHHDVGEATEASKRRGTSTRVGQSTSTAKELRWKQGRSGRRHAVSAGRTGDQPLEGRNREGVHLRLTSTSGRPQEARRQGATCTQRRSLGDEVSAKLPSSGASSFEPAGR
jgi:hypothetical protein